MEYIFQHHHFMRNQPFESLIGARVILVEADGESRAFYTQQLANVEMQVEAYDNLSQILGILQGKSTDFQPDVLIVNLSKDLPKGINFLQSFRKVYPQLPVISMSLTMPDESIDAIMNGGASLHINRGLTRPRDLLLALEQILLTK